jgi:hypothetical protein
MEAMDRAAATPEQIPSAPSSSVDVDFNSLAETEILVDLATQEEDEEDEEPTAEPPATSNRPSAFMSVTNANMCIPAIKREHLFNYPPAGTLAAELHFFSFTLVFRPLSAFLLR